jgi:hypothetical protein
MSKHTPGPWLASQTYPGNDYCIHAQGIPWQLAYLATHSQIEWPLEANARLIAAAPDLLEALQMAKTALELRGPGWPLDVVDAAIAKATDEK